MNNNIEKLMNTERPFLADGGFETWMIFVEGFEAPEFAALVLMDNAKARHAMQHYFDRFLGMAAAANVGFVLDTNTWRGCVSWAEKLGTTQDDLLRLSRDAVAHAMEIRDHWAHVVQPIIINGVVGPAGDGYDAAEAPDADAAEFGHLHAAMRPLLPNLRVIGGCCGTDHRHVGCVSDHLHQKKAA